MQELLEAEHFDATTWVDGTTAYPKIVELQPSLVLLDIHMQEPEQGMTLLNLLRLDPQTSAIPVIICSADTRLLTEKAEQLAAHGCLVLEKPFDLDELLAMVHSALAAS